MRKIIAVLAVAFAVSVSAQDNQSVNVTNDETTVVAQNDGFVVVKLEELPEPVQTAIKSEIEKNGHKIKEVSLDKANKVIKVVAITAENTEIVYNFDETGAVKK